MTYESIQATDKAEIAFRPGGKWRVVLCNGMIRSASTWSYNVVLKIMRAAAGESVYGDYNENIAQFLESSPPAAPYLVLKCHMLDAVGRGLIERGEARVVYTCRDLADAAVSFMRMFQFDFEHTLSALGGALELYRLHRDSGHALILGYREITSRPLESVAKIAGHLGVTAPANALERITEETSLERARARVEQLKTGVDADKLVRFDRFVHDRETLLNLDHIRDGRRGYGRASLTEQQLDRIVALARQYEYDLD
ncbi:MAG: sulfotransferase domain-containing protein [Terracidiphilus sp.]